MTEKTGRTRNPRGEGARLRDDIVAAAVALLDEAGDANAITLRSVARRVGIAAPSIYRHFPDQPAIMLAVVRQAFDELAEQLRTGLDSAVPTPRGRLFAVCYAYLRFAQEHPERYRTMFGGVWMPSLNDTSVTETDLMSLGDACIQLLSDALSECVSTGASTSTNPHADTIALWLGLHGLAHQRAAMVAFPWPPGDMGNRIITRLACLTGG